LTYKIFYSYKRTLYSTYTVKLISLLPYPVGTTGTLSLSLFLSPLLYALPAHSRLSHLSHSIIREQRQDIIIIIFRNERLRSYSRVRKGARASVIVVKIKYSSSTAPRAILHYASARACAQPIQIFTWDHVGAVDAVKRI